ncbi:hypothetical protein ACIQZD_13680 [Peribacillus sp. NPDC096447]|uniref:hypothetical protein n=1 Tax=Peribacillus sp. NPDC096447 TaxID=3364394 RepID=UPI00381B061A
MLKMTTGKFVQIPNVAFGFGTEYKLNKDDIRVYAYLQWARNVGTMKVRTNVEIIVEDLGWETTKASRDKTRVAVALQNLMDKGYIEMTFKKDIKKDNLTIIINKEEMKKVEAKSTVDWKTNPFTFKGYTDIKVDEYNLADQNDYHLLMVGYYLWRNNAGFEYAICDNEWADVLELGVKHTRTIIDDYTPFLNKISGAKFKDENGQWKQEPNTYIMDKHMSIEDKAEKVSIEVKKETYGEKHMSKVLDETVMTNNKIYKQIFDFKVFLEDAGYKVWKETTCEHTKKTGQIKIDKMMKSEGGRYAVERLETKYQKDIDSAKERERQREVMHKRAEQHMAEMEEEYVPSFKPKKQEDLSFFDDI